MFLPIVFLLSELANKFIIISQRVPLLLHVHFGPQISKIIFIVIFGPQIAVIIFIVNFGPQIAIIIFIVHFGPQISVMIFIVHWLFFSRSWSLQIGFLLINLLYISSIFQYPGCTFVIKSSIHVVLLSVGSRLGNVVRFVDGSPAGSLCLHDCAL